MPELQVPDLVNNYLTFCNYRERATSTKVIDLSSCSWLFPTTLLLLGDFIKKNQTMKYLPPYNHNVANYVGLVRGVIKIEELENKSYVPCVQLPNKREKVIDILEFIFKLHKNGKEYGGENVFKYLVSELVDNIYQHSEFHNALVMAQRYDKKGFVEICFFDDGITIPGSFQKAGLIFNDHEAIVRAVNGLSTKSKDRGYGLSTNLDIFTKGMNGEVLIVSRAGALYIGKNLEKLYILKQIYTLEGTLISIRIPLPAPKVDLYEHLN
ncbi:sensor histidine kinase [Candidatus Woesearchaeota archaeon]|nr:sensor histidine kinase [Candidatus Woesearchaeota archaeon]